jgi:hypothetical protein
MSDNVSQIVDFPLGLSTQPSNNQANDSINDALMTCTPRMRSIAAINKEFLGLDLVNEYGAQRLQDVADKKKRDCDP